MMFLKDSTLETGRPPQSHDQDLGAVLGSEVHLWQSGPGIYGNMTVPDTYTIYGSL